MHKYAVNLTKLNIAITKAGDKGDEEVKRIYIAMGGKLAEGYTAEETDYKQPKKNKNETSNKVSSENVKVGESTTGGSTFSNIFPARKDAGATS